MATAFIAVQCFNCSTMQVKQQKKSSNKWTCVICNEKQSVRKVFARSFLAKDVRGFVQSFNTSRQFSEIDPYTPRNGFPAGDGGNFPAPEAGLKRSPRRNDWSEYLDSEVKDEGQKSTGNGGNFSAPEIGLKRVRRPNDWAEYLDCEEENEDQDSTVSCKPGGAFQAMVSIATIGLYIGYALPILFRITLARKSSVPEPFNLGRFGVLVGWITDLWVATITVLFSLPVAYPITKDTLNYTPVAVGDLFLLTILSWILNARHWFR